MKKIGILFLALILIASAYAPTEDSYTDNSYCDANTQCPEGNNCYKFPGEDKATCYSGNPCDECESKECTLLESYPVQVKCIYNCYDSDGGKEYYTKGNVQAEATGKHDDYCKGDTVVEFFCDNDLAKSITYNCPFGCSNGRCVRKDLDVDFIVSTDKENYYYGNKVTIKSKVTGENSKDVEVETIVITPEGNEEKVEVERLGCYNTGDAVSVASEYCLFQGSYLLKAKDTNADTEDLYKVMSTATLDGVSKTADTRFKVKYVVIEDVELDLKEKYSYGETIRAKVRNNDYSYIKYYARECGASFNVERFVDNQWVPLRIYNPCYDCDAELQKELKKGSSDIVGIWNQRTYSECNENRRAKFSEAEKGLYRVVFEYSDSTGERHQAVKKFLIGTSTGLDADEAMEDHEDETDKQEDCEKVCKNYGTRSEGWYDSCTGELIEYADCHEEADCNGCLSDHSCLPFGTRLSKDSGDVYCDVSMDFVKQKNNGEKCQNNYECLTNSCTSGECADLAQEIRETRSLVERLLGWLKSIFGK